MVNGNFWSNGLTRLSEPRRLRTDNVCKMVEVRVEAFQISLILIIKRPIPSLKSDFQVAELRDYGTSQVAGSG